MLHLNELPLRHLFKSLDGSTQSPTTFSGPIGKLLDSCHLLATVEFDRIVCANFPSIDPSIEKDLSTDQLYLYRICLFIQGLLQYEKVTRQKPGKVAHSRWLTTANRIVRLYVSTPASSPFYEALKSLATYIVRVYAPIWFNVKKRSEIKFAGGLFFELVKRSRYLPKDQRDIIDKVLRTNFFAGHSESVLLSMMADPLKQAKAIEIITKIRTLRTSQNDIRLFRCPRFQFDAVSTTSPESDYDTLIDWDDLAELYEPPVLKQIPTDQLSTFKVPAYPLHTQAVERAIQLITQLSSKVTTSQKRTGMAITTMFSRSQTGNVDSKKNYNVIDTDSI